jgi:hypothetical protein
VTARDAQIVQAAGNLHDPVGDACFGQAQHIFDNPAALDPRNRVLDDDTCAGEDPIELPLLCAQRFASGLFFGCRVNTPGGS